MAVESEARRTGRLPPLTGADRLFVLKVSLSHTLQHVYSSALPLTYPFVVAELHTSYATLGLVLGVSRVLGGLLQGLAGLFGRASGRTLLGGQNLLLAVAAAAAGAAPNFPLFAAAGWAGSIFAAPQHPVGSAALSGRFPERRASALSWHNTGGSVGTLAAPLLTSAVIARWGWRPALWLVAIPLAVGGLLLLLSSRRDWQQARHEGTRRSLAPRTLLQRASVIILASATVAAAGRGLGTLGVYVPAYLKSGLGLEPIGIGLVVTIIALGAVVGPPLTGMLADRVGARRLIFVSYLGGAAGIAGFVLSGHNLVLLVAAALLMGLLAYSESPLLQSIFSDMVGSAGQQGAFGVYFAIVYGAGSLWVVALGTIIDRYGFQPAFLLMAASFLSAAALLTLLPRRRPAA